ncbi:MAG: septal ring lytic transglycosylase RlpA family protein [Rhodospirillales bacterium]|nr:septal ring lytic transglycosylase RlpA family protein [Rhodospirillales bacterium]
MNPHRAFINRGTSGLMVLIAATMLLGACAETQFIAQTVKQVSKKSDEEKKASFGRYKIGKPYQIKGVWYYPQVNYDYDETGIGSWYGAKFHGRKTANGEIYDMNGISAAHRTLPLPSIVRVTNLGNGRTLNIRINDRGPYAHGRILDLSRRAAQLLGFEKQGTASIRVRVLANESRTLATRLKGDAELAEIGTPITIDSMPKPKVSSQTLPVIGSSDQNEQLSPTPVSAPLPPEPVVNQEQLAASPTTGEVTLEPVLQQTRIFIQAGAFANFDNANRVRAILSSLGSVKVSPVLVNGRDLFRVRVGPINSVADADHMLERVIASGYTDARTIVD